MASSSSSRLIPKPQPTTINQRIPAHHFINIRAIRVLNDPGFNEALGILEQQGWTFFISNPRCMEVVLLQQYYTTAALENNAITCIVNGYQFTIEEADIVNALGVPSVGANASPSGKGTRNRELWEIFFPNKEYPKSKAQGQRASMNNRDYLLSTVVYLIFNHRQGVGTTINFSSLATIDDLVNRRVINWAREIMMRLKESVAKKDRKYGRILTALLSHIMQRQIPTRVSTELEIQNSQFRNRAVGVPAPQEEEAEGDTEGTDSLGSLEEESSGETDWEAVADILNDIQSSPIAEPSSSSTSMAPSPPQSPEQEQVPPTDSRVISITDSTESDRSVPTSEPSRNIQRIRRQCPLSGETDSGPSKRPRGESSEPQESIPVESAEAQEQGLRQQQQPQPIQAQPQQPQQQEQTQQQQPSPTEPEEDLPSSEKLQKLGQEVQGVKEQMKKEISEEIKKQLSACFELLTTENHANRLTSVLSILNQEDRSKFLEHRRNGLLYRLSAKHQIPVPTLQETINSDVFIHMKSLFDSIGMAQQGPLTAEHQHDAILFSEISKLHTDSMKAVEEAKAKKIEELAFISDPRLCRLREAEITSMTLLAKLNESQVQCASLITERNKLTSELDKLLNTLHGIGSSTPTQPPQR